MCNCVAHLVGFLRLQLQLLCRLAKRTRIASPAAAAFVIFICAVSARHLSVPLLFFVIPSLSFFSPLYCCLFLSVCLNLENGFVCGSLVLKLRASLCAAAAPCKACLPSLSLSPLSSLFLLLHSCIPLHLLQRHSTLINATFACCSCQAAAAAASATVAVQLQVQLQLLVH